MPAIPHIGSAGGGGEGHRTGYNEPRSVAKVTGGMLRPDFRMTDLVPRKLGPTLAAGFLLAFAGCSGPGNEPGAEPAAAREAAGSADSAAPREAAAEPAGAPASSGGPETVPDPASPSREMPPEPEPVPDAALAEPVPHLRVAWTRDVGAGTDVVSYGDQLVLMALDSEDGRGERVMLGEPASYAKPLITPDGDTIVFTIRQQGAYAIDWDGEGLRRVADGFALDVWADPADGSTWVYVGGNERLTDPPQYPLVRRHRLDDPTVAEVVWDAQPVSGDSFQVSADGRTAAALLPWPTAGVIDLESGTWRKLGEGCWTAFSPGADPLFWYFDGAHRNLTVVDVDTDERWGVPINDDPIFGGYEVYHPRWTNDQRAIVLTGPYTVGSRANKIRGGGRQVEIHVGFFDETVTSVARWQQVTHNDAPDFYPDAWIEPGTGPAPHPRSARTARPDAPADAGTDASPVVADVRVRQDVAPPTPESIAPYREGLLALEYDVVRVVEGELDLPVIAVAHWVIRDARPVAGAVRRAGERLRLRLHPYDARPELEGKRLVFETADLTLPLFYDVASADLTP